MISRIASKYKDFLEALQDTESKDESQDAGFMIFYDLFKIREAQLSYKLSSKRAIDFSLSDIFQDIIAHYLRKNLPKGHDVILEHTQNKLRPDILIKKEGKNVSVIEVKTTIGWNRDLVKGDNYMARLRSLSKEFDVPLDKVFYIFEASRNVNKEFNGFFKANNNLEIRNFIFPLFEFNASPYYFSKKLNRKDTKYSDEEILKLYNEYKITSFKTILNKITS